MSHVNRFLNQFCKPLKTVLTGILLGFLFILFGDEAYSSEPIQNTELKRSDAYKMLKQNGFRWKETELPMRDAESKSLEARSYFLPHISFAVREYAGRVNPLQYGITNTGEPSFFLAGSTGFTFVQALFDLTALHRIEAATFNQKRSAALTAQYRGDLTYLMLVQFLNAQRLKKKIEVIEASVTRAEEILKLAELRVSSGLGLSLDAMRAQSLVSAERFKKTDAEFMYAKAKRELAITLGQADLTPELEPVRYLELDLKSLQPVTEELVENRVDIMAAQFAFDASIQLKRSVSYDWVPKVALVGDLGYVGASPLGLGGVVNTLPTGTLALQISVPIYTGGLNASRAVAEGVKVVKTENDLFQAQIEAQSQITLALAQIKHTQTAVLVSTQYVGVAQEELKLSQKRFVSGSASGLEITNSQANLAVAQDMNVEAICGYELAKINYFRAIGRLATYLGTEERG